MYLEMANLVKHVSAFSYTCKLFCPNPNMDTETERSRKRLLDKLDCTPGFQNKNVAELLAVEKIHTWSDMGRLTPYEWTQLVRRLPKKTDDIDGPNFLAPGHLNSLDELHEEAQRDYGFKLTALDRKRRNAHMLRSRSAGPSYGATVSHVPLTSAWLYAHDRQMPLITVADDEDGHKDKDEHASKDGDEHASKEGDEHASKDEHTSKEGDEHASQDEGEHA
jgi:hypothetical protein